MEETIIVENNNEISKKEDIRIYDRTIGRSRKKNDNELNEE